MHTHVCGQASRKYVTGFEKKQLPWTQQQCTFLPSNNSCIYTLTNSSGRYQYWKLHRLLLFLRLIKHSQVLHWSLKWLLLPWKSRQPAKVTTWLVDEVSHGCSYFVWCWAEIDANWCYLAVLSFHGVFACYLRLWSPNHLNLCPYRSASGIGCISKTI